MAAVNWGKTEVPIELLIDMDLLLGFAMDACDVVRPPEGQDGAQEMARLRGQIDMILREWGNE